MYIIQKIRKQFVRHFRATWLIRYVEMAKDIFTSSKHRFAGVNFPPGNKNWQCTAITTMRIKQKQAQLTPDQNSTNTIRNPNDGRKFAIWLARQIELAQNSRKCSTNEENFPSRLKTLTICTSPKFEQLLELIGREWSITEREIWNPNWAREIERALNSRNCFNQQGVNFPSQLKRL